MGLHFALYEEGISNFEEAILNMNNYIGRLLELSPNKIEKVLDAGCGVGGSSIYLAQRFPNNDFTGITITPVQRDMAENFAKERNLKNLKFELMNYLDTKFPDNHFDKIFALESSCYAADKEKLVSELHRILKPSGYLVVIDGFNCTELKNPIMKKYHDFVCKGRGLPFEEIVYGKFKKIINKNGFKIVEENDLRNSVYKSSLRSFIIGIPFIISSMLKLIFIRKYDISKDPDYYVGASVLCGIYGLMGETVYCAIKAKKI